MIKSHNTRLPTIERKQSSRTINQMIKSIMDYSLEKKRLLNFSSETKTTRPISSGKNLVSKINLELPEKLPPCKKQTQTTSNSLTSDSSGAQIQKYHVALSNRVLQIRGLISQIIDKTPAKESKNFRQISCHEPRSVRYSKSPFPIRKDINEYKTKFDQRKEYYEVSCSKEIILRKSKGKKPKLNLVSAANKVSKPLFNGSPKDPLNNFIFDQEIRPWSRQCEVEF